ncbi:glycerate kinase [Varibaculum vaginae]|uniref:glycerate kinase n=1 Tax=Varibaculum vaginae TaxID=2364797 RepID=UPI000F088F9A|nr:glycerate kinase [Varibaculum vaginae]
MQIVLAVTSTASASAQELGEAFRAGWLRHQNQDKLQVTPYSYGFSEVAANFPLVDIFAGAVDPERAGLRLPALLQAGKALYLPPCNLGESLQSEYLSPGAVSLGKLEELPDFPGAFMRGVARAYGQKLPDAQIWENLGRALSHTMVVTGSKKPLFSTSGILAAVAKSQPAIAQKAKENWETVFCQIEGYGSCRYLNISGGATSGLRGGGNASLPGGGCAWGIGELLGRLGARLDFAADLLDQRTRLPQILADADLLVANTSELSPWNLSGSPLEHLCQISAPSGIPIVVITGENNLSRAEISKMGIDGVYRFPADISGMNQAGLRLARTWSR